MLDIPSFKQGRADNFMARSLASEKELRFRPTSLLVVLIAVLSILAVLLASAHQLRQERALVEQSVKIENRSRVQSFEQFVLRTLAVADIALRHIQNHAARDIDGLSIHQSPTDPVINSPIFTASVISIPGRLYMATRTELKLTPSQLREIQALAWSNPQKAAVTAPLELQGLGQQVGVVRPLLEYPGGFAVVFLNPRRLTDYAENVPFGQYDLISLIGLDGITRARRTGDAFTNGERVKGLVMERQLAEPDGDYVGPSVLDGISRYFSHQRLEDYRLFATSGIPTSTVDERMEALETRQFVLIAAAIAAILTGAGVILGSMHRNRMRLDDLVQANVRLNEAQRIGSMGDWDYYPETDQLHWSDNLRRMYGRGSDEAVSNMDHVAQYVSSRDHERIGRTIRKILKTGKSGSWEVKARIPGGDFSYRRVIAAPIFDADGKIVGIHGTDQDVTAERMIREMEKKLAELARLDSMGALTATLAHELNQPLAIAANYLAAASRGLGRAGQSEKARKYIQSAQAQIDHLAQIIAGARELVSHSDSTHQNIDLSVLTDELEELLHETVKRAPSRIDLQLADDAGHVCANKAQMKQVLFNLCRNAVEAVPQGAWPEIVIASVRQPDGMIRIEVRDNGQGFADHLDDPFAALVTNKASGLGLGLALARTIIEHHGGKIWVKETGPSGTTIALTVPQAWEEGDTDDA